MLDDIIKHKIYEDAVEYTESIEVFRKLLDWLTLNVDNRTKWTKTINSRSKAFIEKHFYRQDKQPAELAADAIIDCLALNRSYYKSPFGQTCAPKDTLKG